MSAYLEKSTYMQSQEGSPSFSKSKRMTALQAHVAFFDRDGDGIIWPIDTYVGCRALNFPVILSFINMIAVHVALSYLTWDHIIPDPFFRIRVDHIHKATHGSDSAAYTKRGNFDNNRFDYVFDLYSDPPHTHITTWQIVKMAQGNMDPFDFFGWLSQFGEWLAAYVLLRNARDHRGFAREDIRKIYNGSIFYEMTGKTPKS